MRYSPAHLERLLIMGNFMEQSSTIYSGCLVDDVYNNFRSLIVLPHIVDPFPVPGQDRDRSHMTI